MMLIEHMCLISIILLLTVGLGHSIKYIGIGDGELDRETKIM